MGQKIHFGLLGVLLIMLTIIIVPAYAGKDTSAIKLQIVVKESMTLSSCEIGFKTHSRKLHHAFNKSCQFDTKKLLAKARELAQKRVKQVNGFEIVMVTITAP